MKKYAVNGLSASGTASKTAFTLISTTSIRTLLAEVTFGVRTNPNATDQQVEVAVGSYGTTNSGTAGSSPTPKPLDLVDPIAAVAAAGITHSAEPTSYASAYWIDTDMNQRGLYRWVAEIGFELGSNAAANSGTAGKLIAVTAAVQVSMVVHFKE